MFLVINGIANTNSYVLNGDSYLYRKQLKENELLLFVGYSAFDIKRGQEFNVAFDKDKPLTRVEFSICRLEYITQESFIEWNEIPHGYKTLCIFYFEKGIPSIVKDIPVIESWIKGIPIIWIATKEYWQEYCAEFNRTT